VAQPEAGGESAFDPFLAGPMQGEARTTTT
jgi:hypothetical protein